MTVDPSQDLRSLGEQGYADDRWRPISVGLASARPTTALMRANSFYYATDDQVLYYSDGVSWTQVSPSGKGAAAWTTYTPSLTNWTLGNGTITGKWVQVGKTVFFRSVLTFGSTTTAASSAPNISLPTAAIANDNTYDVQARFWHSPSMYQAAAYQVSTTVYGAFIIGTNGVYLTPSTTTPFTWATGDQVLISGTYEAA